MKPKKRVQCLPVDVRRCCTSEGGEDDIGAAGIVAFLLEDVCHLVVEGVDHFGLAGACPTMHDYQGWRGLGNLVIWGGSVEGDEPLGIIDTNGEHLLLHSVQLSRLFNLNRIYTKNCRVQI